MQVSFFSILQIQFSQSPREEDEQITQVERDWVKNRDKIELIIHTFYQFSLVRRHETILYDLCNKLFFYNINKIKTWVTPKVYKIYKPEQGKW